MREWSLRSDDPLELTLACDARLVLPDYSDDQVWQINTGGSEPIAIDLHTTFGLRAQGFRMFPRFSKDEEQKTDPVTFFEPPIFTRLYPNYIKLKFSPFQDINVIGEYHVPDSKSIRVCYKITNASVDPRTLVFDWVCLLKPINGKSMTSNEIENTHMLTGSSQGLLILVAMSGDTELISSPYPSIKNIIEIEPNGTKSFQINHSAQKTIVESLKHVRQIGKKTWDSEIARLEMSNASWIDIYTGEPDWDKAFMLSQKVAHSLIYTHPSISSRAISLKTRHPDHGYSSNISSVKYCYSGAGTTPIETLYHTSFLPPNEIHIAKGWLLNYLSKQESDGFINWKSDPSEKKGRLLAPPVLSNMAWQIFEKCHDKSFLSELYPILLKFFTHWFSPEHDRDSDGLPEWDHPYQTGIEEHPIYDSYQSWSHGQNINSLEMPSLCSFLYRESQALLNIGTVIKIKKHIKYLEESASNLESNIVSLWSEQDSCYLARDRDSHRSPASEFISQQLGSGTMLVNKSYQDPVRLLVHIQRSGDTTVKPHLIIYGTSVGGYNRIEHILPERVQWRIDAGFATGDRLYSHIDQIDIKGIGESDKVEIISTNNRFVDISNLLPIWSGFSNREQIEKLVNHTISNPQRFWHTHGMPICPNVYEERELEICSYVDIPFNTLIGIGLVNHNFHKFAAELTTKLMSAVIYNLKNQKSFYRYYHAEKGYGYGERNVINGLAPLGLFLKTLGVEWISNKQIFLQGFNPYPWPVTVKYQGTNILWQNEKRIVTFPDGQTLIVDSPEPCIVSL